MRIASSKTESLEKRVSGSVPVMSQFLTSISSRAVRRASCGGIVPLSFGINLNLISSIKPRLHEIHSLSQHFMLGSSQVSPTFAPVLLFHSGPLIAS